MTRPDPRRNSPTTPDIESPVFRYAGQMAPRVRQADSPWTWALGLGFAAVLGIIVFASLSAGRQARADNAHIKPVAATLPAPPVFAAASVQQPPAVPIVAAPPPAPAPLPPVPSQDPSLALHAPVMVVDQSDVKTAPATIAGAAAGQNHAEGGEPAGSAEERFEARVASGAVETSHASQLTDLTHVMPQGTVIPAVLETAINSDLPGSVRAVVSQDVRGFDGSTVLIPRGSKLIGQYRSGMAYGQSRAFVVWARVLTPDGVSIDVGSPGTDPLGRGGLAGETDTHFFERFGGSILLSVISTGLEAAVQRGSNTAVIIGSPIQASNLASTATPPADIPVTIKVMQGTPLQVFLVRDLDFSGVAAARR